MPHNKIAVIGAGITGLTAAYTLQQSGRSVEVFERKGEPGGAIKTVKTGKWQVEYGPNTLQLKQRRVAEFINQLGLRGEMIIANQEAGKRFIVKNGRLEPLPASILRSLQTPLFSWKGKLRIAGEPFIPRNKNRNESVADFVKRRLGREVLEYAINPFVAGIFANNPKELSLRHAFPVMDSLEQEYGSLIAGALAVRFKKRNPDRIPSKLVSFTKGIQQLPAAIVSRLNSCYFNHEVTTIKRQDDAWYLFGPMGTFGPYSDVVVNIPAYRWDEQLLPLKPEQLQAVSRIEYAPLSVMLLGYKHENVEHALDGFGFLVPEVEKRNILGALFSSTLFPGRAPEGHHLLTVFVGGGRQPELADMESAKLFALVRKELRDLIGVRGEPVFKDHIYWPKSIPKYHIGYDDVLNRLQDVEREHPGLHIGGNFRNGISVPDCILNGLKIGKKLAR